MDNLEGSIFTWLVHCQTGNFSDVTLAFIDAQPIPPFSREKTDDTDDTDYTDDTNDTYQTDDTDGTDDTDDTDGTGIGLNRL